MAIDDMLLWLDVETTGLDPHGRDVLLEVGAIGTDLGLNEVTEPFERVVRFDAGERDRLRSEVASDFVRRMHDESGLWDRLPEGTPLDQVDQDLSDFIDSFAPNPRQARLAGNSVSRVDVPFSEVFLPLSTARLHYRILDISSLAFAHADVFGWVDGYYPKKKRHRGLDDIRESLAEARWLRDGMLRATRGLAGSIPLPDAYSTDPRENFEVGYRTALRDLTSCSGAARGPAWSGASTT